MGSHPGGKGRLQALHAQGDLGAAASRSRHHAGPRFARLRQGLPGRDEDLRRRAGYGLQHQHRRLRHQLARGPRRQIHDRAAGPPARRCGLRQRISLPQSHPRPQRPRPAHHPIRRNRGHPGRAARDDRPRLKDRGHLQCRRRHGGPRGARRNLHARRPGDRRRLHQGLYRATDRPVSCWRSSSANCAAGSTRPSR